MGGGRCQGLVVRQRLPGDKTDGHPDPGKETVIRLIRELGALGVNAIDTDEGNATEDRTADKLSDPFGVVPIRIGNGRC